jgi:hypothetical protein
MVVFILKQATSASASDNHLRIAVMGASTVMVTIILEQYVV